MSKEAELKPCPFCGQSDRVVGPEYNECQNVASFWIECERCEVIVSRDTKTLTDRAWNTRPAHENTCEMCGDDMSCLCNSCNEWTVAQEM